MSRPGEVAHHLAEPLGERGQLELLDLHHDEASSLARLEQEEAAAHLAAGAHHDPVGSVEDVLHEATSSLSAPVELTHNTTGASSERAIALTEQVEMTVRWKRSSGTPSA